MVISGLGMWLMTMRSSMISTMSDEFVQFARVRGLGMYTILYRYAMRVALLPSLTGFGISLGFVISGALLTEMVFAYPGQGYILIQAVRAQDYPLMQGNFSEYFSLCFVGQLACGLFDTGLGSKNEGEYLMHSFFLKLYRQNISRYGIYIVGFFVVVSIFGSFFTMDPLEYVNRPLLEPCLEHPFGTNGQGQDVLAQTIVGSQTTIWIGFVGGTLVVMVGTLIGGIAGYYGGKVNDILSLGTNIFMIIPGLPHGCTCCISTSRYVVYDICIGSNGMGLECSRYSLSGSVHSATRFCSSCQIGGSQ